MGDPFRLTEFGKTSFLEMSRVEAEYILIANKINQTFSSRVKHSCCG